MFSVIKSKTQKVNQAGVEAVEERLHELSNLNVSGLKVAIA